MQPSSLNCIFASQAGVFDRPNVEKFNKSLEQLYFLSNLMKIMVAFYHIYDIM